MIAGSSKWCIWFPRPCLTPSHPIPSLPCSHSEVQGDFILTWLHLQRSHCQGHILKFWVSINLGGGPSTKPPFILYILSSCSAPASSHAHFPQRLYPVPQTCHGPFYIGSGPSRLRDLKEKHLTLRRSLSCMLFLSVYCLLDISSANIFLGQVTPFYALLEPLSLPLWHLLSL